MKKESLTVLLEVKGLSKSFGGLQAVRAISFSVAATEVVGVIGANGAGKTTLFSLIAGNLRPTVGEILLDGKPIQGLRADLVCRSGIARTYQVVKPFSGMSVLDNVLTAALFGTRQQWNKKAAENVSKEILSEVGLYAYRNRNASALTLSARKRLEMARALATGPRLIMLDEVMAGLTPTEMSSLLDTIQEIKAHRSLTILLVEHVMRAVTRLASRLLVLHHGELIAEGSPTAVVNDQRVIEAYLGKPR